jgi:hypothetical protein
MSFISGKHFFSVEENNQVTGDWRLEIRDLPVSSLQSLISSLYQTITCFNF